MRSGKRLGLLGSDLLMISAVKQNESKESSKPSKSNKSSKSNRKCKRGSNRESNRDVLTSSPFSPSLFECLYESVDKKLVLFETGDGHLVAVDASKLI